MKKRIISTILLLAMSLLVLAGCAYSFADDDMSAYASFKSSDFVTDILALTILDGDFTTDDNIRRDKVNDAIYTLLAKEVDADEKNTEGTPSGYDLLYYCYYCTVEVDIKGAEEGEPKTKTVILFASAMKESAAEKVQLGLSSNDGIKKLIAEALAEVDFTDVRYSTVTDRKTKTGDKLVVSYTKEYTTDSEDEEIVIPKKVTQSYVEIDSTHELYSKLMDKDINVSISIDDTKETVDSHEFDVKYSGVKVHWIVENKTEAATVKDVTYTAKKEVTDVNGDTYDLKDKELTYHVFPVYYQSVAALDADSVLRVLLAENIAHAHDANEDGDFDDDEDTKGSLASFANLNYKNGEDTLNALVEKLEELQKDLADAEKSHSTAQTNYDSAKATVDKAGDEATSTQQNALNDAKDKLDEAKATLDEAQEKVDEQIEKIYGVTVPAEDITDGIKDIKDVIVNDYWQSQYEVLEEKYKADIKSKLAAEVYAKAKKYVEFGDNLPKKAVDNEYDKLLNDYKYDYYEGNYSTSGDTTVTNYDYYRHRGEFLGFLIKELNLKDDATMKDAKAAIRAEAEAEVKDLVIVYTLADFYDISLTEEEIEEAEAAAEYYNYLYQYIYGASDAVEEEDFIHAKLFDKVMNYILEEKEPTAEDGNKVVYERVDYSFKTEDETEEN